jgi:3'(2'), 5'-bisphosphate nucleotidase
VTEADLAAHHLLVEGLAPFGLPVLSEESVEQAASRGQWEVFWMVDPLDGTREFLERTGEFTVNIALIEGQRATLGLIAIPLTGELFIGGPGLGAWRRVAHGWEAVHCRELAGDRPVVVLTSRRHRGKKLKGWLSRLEARTAGVERRHSGSAIKFCRLAEGVADCYPRFAPCSEWDTAAGQALLEGAGGGVLALDGRPLRYNARDSLLSPDFLALANPGHAVWSQLRGGSG